MSSPRRRPCKVCGFVYKSGTYTDHRFDPIHRAALAGRRMQPKETDQSESWATLEAAGTSRSDIAAQAGVSRQYVSQVLLRSGRRSHSNKAKRRSCFMCGESYFNPWSEHQTEEEHILRTKMLVERLETLSKGETP